MKGAEITLFTHLYSQLLSCINKDPRCHQIESKRYTGVNFLYITWKGQKKETLEICLQRCAQQITRRSSLTYQHHFVRQSGDCLIYRFTFFVPNEKSFCCGNECEDCILFRRSHT
ncbi:hypothetical protein [Mechercharimyces sp. CAU 1602]|uniref:hypothetical protein n=1 Tax=Mechercharimyces sp. CAU 1602 TaxID=2973933 RepID=UPI002161D04A|nr:hypothetical protein [Mechercharimyces sp. CAU 1602]MCS1350181.1 hypothetical protein [Mechercharimyces sp. CAU 1602]